MYVFFVGPGQSCLELLAKRSPGVMTFRRISAQLINAIAYCTVNYQKKKTRKKSCKNLKLIMNNIYDFYSSVLVFIPLFSTVFVFGLILELVKNQFSLMLMHLTYVAMT